MFIFIFFVGTEEETQQFREVGVQLPNPLPSFLFFIVDRKL
jgi:hypothetical protein